MDFVCRSVLPHAQDECVEVMDVLVLVVHVQQDKPVILQESASDVVTRYAILN